MDDVVSPKQEARREGVSGVEKGEVMTDGITQWMLKNNIPFTLRNYLTIAYWKRVRLTDLGPEEITQIPARLLPKKYRRN